MMPQDKPKARLSEEREKEIRSDFAMQLGPFTSPKWIRDRVDELLAAIAWERQQIESLQSLLSHEVTTHTDTCEDLKCAEEQLAAAQRERDDAVGALSSITDAVSALLQGRPPNIPALQFLLDPKLPHETRTLAFRVLKAAVAALATPSTAVEERDARLLHEAVESGTISDGHHTFTELYQHRHALFCVVVREYSGWKSKLHDDGTMYDGWFLAGCETPTGTISYHLPLAWWDRCDVVERERAEKWDGYSPNNVIERLGTLPCLIEPLRAQVAMLREAMAEHAIVKGMIGNDLCRYCEWALPEHHEECAYANTESAAVAWLAAHDEEVWAEGYELGFKDGQDNDYGYSIRAKPEEG